MTQRLTLRRPDDWHLHLRDGAMLDAVLPESARHFARAIIMPNLIPPVVTGAQAAAYRDRILAALPDGMTFEPLMTLYLTETTDPEDVAAAAASGLVKAVKLYPAGATTNSASGVRDFDRVRPVLERMAEIGLPLCVHGEVVDPEVDIFDREAVFIDRVLDPVRRATPGLRVVMEHVTTAEGVAYARSGGADLAATITAHHLVINRNHILAGGIRPHYYCLPVAKRETHRLALVQAATAGEACFFLGTDSAPHPDPLKEHACGCAGCFTATNALSVLAEVFDRAGALDRLEGFVSLNGPAFYRLPANEDRIALVRGEAAVYAAEDPLGCRAGDRVRPRLSAALARHPGRGMSPRALLLNGPCGVGKTTVADQISRAMNRHPRALIDLDALTKLFPHLPDDPHGFADGLANLKAMRPHLAARGIDALIVAYVIETADDLDRLADAVGGPVTHCLLTADRADLHSRLAGRETGASLDWHKTRADTLSDVLRHAPAPDLTIDTSGRDPEELAETILAATGWPDRTGAPRP